MTSVDRLITEYKLVTQGPRSDKSYLVVPTMPVDVYEIDATRDDLHPAWIVLGFMLIAAEYFWLLSAAG